MADFGLDWDSEDDSHIELDPAVDPGITLNDLDKIEQEEKFVHPKNKNISKMKHSSKTKSTIPSRIPPKSLKIKYNYNPANSDQDLIEPMVRDPSKQQEIRSIEKADTNLTPLEAVCTRYNSIYVFQRVWAAKEIKNLIDQTEKTQTMNLLVPITMKLAEDKHLIVKEAMAQNILPTLLFYYKNCVEMGVDNQRTSTEDNKTSESLKQENNQLKDLSDIQDKPNELVPKIKENDYFADSKDGESSDEGGFFNAKKNNISHLKVPTTGEFQLWIHQLLLSPHLTISQPVQIALVALGKSISFEDFHTRVVHGIVLSLEKNVAYENILKLRVREEEMIIKTRGQPTPEATESTKPEPTNNDDPKEKSSLGEVPLSSASSNSSAFTSKIANLFGMMGLSSEKEQDKKLDRDPSSYYETSDGNISSNSNTPLNLGPNSDQSGSGLLNLSLFGTDTKSSNNTNGPINSTYQEQHSIQRKLLMLNLIQLLVEEYGSWLRPAVFVPVIERTCRDKSFEVRRDAAMVIGSLCKAVSTELSIEILYPAFVKLSQDSVWHVPRTNSWQFLSYGWGSSKDQVITDKKQVESSPTLTDSTNIPGSLSGKIGSKIRGSSSWFLSKKKSSSPLNLSSLDEIPAGINPPKEPETLKKIDKEKNSSKGFSSDGKISTLDGSNDTIKVDQKLKVTGSFNVNTFISEKQWLQIIDKLAGYREPSEHVRSAVFESIGKLFIAFANEPKITEYLLNMISKKVNKASSSWSDNRRSSSGSTSIMGDVDVEDDDILGDAIDLGGFSVPSKYPASSGYSDFNGVVSYTTKSGSHGIGGRWNSRKSDLRWGGVSKDVLYHCAFNFPAILQAVGPSMWDRLRETYILLTKVDQFDVRCTLASSLHEVAKILSQGQRVSIEKTRVAQKQMRASNDSKLSPLNDISGNTLELLTSHSTIARSISSPVENSTPMSKTSLNYSNDLEQALCLFLLETNEIKIRILKHLGEAMRIFPEQSRMRCLPMILQVFRHDSKDWRTREIMASQLVQLCELFPATITVSQILPIAVEWANDPVAGVRASVAPAFSVLFSVTKDYPELQVLFFQKVIEFSHSPTFRGRVFFIQICSALLANDSGNPSADAVDFDQFFLPSLASLATDKVPNVRIALARLVRRMLENRVRRQSVSSVLGESFSFSNSSSISKPNPTTQTSDTKIHSSLINSLNETKDSLGSKVSIVDIESVNPEESNSNQKSSEVEAEKSGPINIDLFNRLQNLKNNMDSDNNTKIHNFNQSNSTKVTLTLDPLKLNKNLISDSTLFRRASFGCDDFISDNSKTTSTSSIKKHKHRYSFPIDKSTLNSLENISNDSEDSSRLDSSLENPESSLDNELKLESPKKHTEICPETNFDKVSNNNTGRELNSDDNSHSVFEFPKIDNEGFDDTSKSDNKNLSDGPLGSDTFTDIKSNYDNEKFVTLSDSPRKVSSTGAYKISILSKSDLHKDLYLKQASATRAHLLITMLQDLSQDKDIDVLEQLNDIPGLSLSSVYSTRPYFNSAYTEPTSENSHKNSHSSKERANLTIDVKTGRESAYEPNSPKLDSLHTFSSPSEENLPHATRKFPTSEIPKQFLEMDFNTGSSGINPKKSALASVNLNNVQPGFDYSDSFGNVISGENMILGAEEKEDSNFELKKAFSLKNPDNSLIMRGSPSKISHRRSSSGHLLLDELPSDLSEALEKIKSSKLKNEVFVNTRVNRLEEKAIDINSLTFNTNKSLPNPLDPLIVIPSTPLKDKSLKKRQSDLNALIQSTPENVSPSPILKAPTAPAPAVTNATMDDSESNSYFKFVN
ncbi:hypothetical protein BB558_007574 [Smittium angustum]|uniref:TOG domain-containing protein n=1 Tax=Smittium angustum TaxID=133377 RepID=A0A2U1IUQ1_SMIAN|nr:hypothetical protein BB558_007574 [Smittium angustum]